MDQNLEALKAFMKGDLQIKIEKFDEITELSASLLADCKKALESGTEEEKKTAVKKLKIFRAALELRFAALKNQISIDEEHMQLAIQFFLAHSPEYRAKVANVKQKIQEQKTALQTLVSPPKPMKRKLRSQRANWIQS